MFYLNNIVDALIPQGLKGDFELYRKAKILSCIHLLMLVLTLISCSAWYYLDLNTDLPYAFAIALTALLITLFKKMGSLTFSGNAIAFTIVLIIAPLSFKSGGLYSLDTLFLVSVPIVGFLLTGARWGLFWTAFLFVYLGYFYYLEINSSVSFREQTFGFDHNYYVTLVSILFFTITAAIYFYERENQLVIKQLKQQRTELEQTKQLLQKSNNELEHEVLRRTEKLQKTNVDLKQANEVLEQFAFVASHDLKEPLRSISSFIQLLEMKYGDVVGKDGKEYIKYAVDGVKRMYHLIEELLAYSKADKMAINFMEVDIRQVINNKMYDVHELIKDKQAIIIVKEMPKKIIAEPNQLGILILNLLTNALKFNNNEQPKVVIGVEEKKDCWVFSVVDNGIGIKDEYKEKIFEIFKRLHKKEEFEGTGIGLALCKKVVERHQGKIWVNSEEGKGSAFYFSIAKGLV